MNRPIRIVSFVPAFFLLLIGLAACQTVQPADAFTRDQVAALDKAGFAKVGDHYELGLDDRLLFGFDSDRLTEQTAAMLARMAHELVAVGITGASVEGHTNSIGAADYNQRLSERRARAVSEALVGSGFRRERVRSYGLGESDPIEENSTEAHRQENRRVVIIVSAADAAPIEPAG